MNEILNIVIRTKKRRDLIPALKIVYTSFSDGYKKVLLILLYPYFVAEVNGKFTGFVIPRKIDNNIGEIYLIAVNKEYSRMGIGYKLLKNRKVNIKRVVNPHDGNTKISIDS